MNFKSFILSLALALVSAMGFAQANILNAQQPEDIGQKTLEELEYDHDEPLEYGYVNDRDIMWAKKTWEVVDLDERINFPLYYPVDTMNIGKDRRSLYDVLMKAASNGEIKTYRDSYFTEEVALKDLEGATKLRDTLEVGYDQYNADGYVDPEYIIEREISAFDVAAYEMMGMWYFDKKQGELRYRLLGIAPRVPDVNFLDEEEQETFPLFWVWFPEARDILHDAKVFNTKNSAHPITFDHLLNSRRFNGIVYKTDNVQGDRRIDEYIADNAMMQLLESERLKEQIRNFELDMWQY